VEALLFERGEPTLRHGVVPALAGPAEALGHLVGLE
jgi:hypothetical protein